MFRILVKKYIHESLLLWLACALVLLFFPWVRIWTVSQFELSGFASILEQFRSFEKFSPVPLEQFLTYQGMVGFTFDEPVLLLCILVWSISRGSDVVSGELNRGTMELLLAQPIERSRLFAAHATVTILGLVLLCILVYAGIYLGIMTNSTPVSTGGSMRIPFLNLDVGIPLSPKRQEWVPLRNFVDPFLYILPTLNLFSLGFMVLGISVLLSARDQYRWRAIGLTIGIYVSQLLLFILSKSTPSTHVLTPFSFLAAYQPDWSVQRIHRHRAAAWSLWSDGDASKIGLDYWMSCMEPPAFIAILLLLGTLAYAIAWRVFTRRDLPAPN
ncbi:ABC-2 family transporter protein [Pirellula sp. SH-Sr6A]|uniref:ABC transporter permease subunit n=1 Tax=Pirellula sp. SH-Sr6A TaxID=1632865 RepID=UPI00078BBF25|nr:ABC transporter permease subunit [Pirellula sp. SH-Sr6A]AMV32298.1 ABC-2 family transporter protein [Pirellula sp. SH-Sr6A]